MTASAPPVSTPASPLAPFRNRTFFWLWLGVVIATIGTWAQTVGAQWLFVDAPNAATIVALVQTATMLPMMMLALPAGVLADAFDRRWLLFGVQVYFIAAALLLAVLTGAGSMSPALLLAFTFAIGAGQAVMQPTWQALIAELVPRSDLAAATRLDMVSVNVARAAGPALAGVVIARWGVPPVFVVTAVAASVLAVILLAWRRPRVDLGRARSFPARAARRRPLRPQRTSRPADPDPASRPSSYLRAPSGRCFPSSPPNSSAWTPTATACSSPRSARAPCSPP